MTPDEIINEIWKLPWYEVYRIAFIDDFILLAKIWPAWLAIVAVVFTAAYLSKKRRRS